MIIIDLLGEMEEDDTKIVEDPTTKEIHSYDRTKVLEKQVQTIDGKIISI